MPRTLTLLRTGLALLTGLALTTLTLPAWAQGTPGSGGPVPGTPDPTPTSVPLDGGASLLLAGGAAYALRRLRRR
jgi:hypothetical protein